MMRPCAFAACAGAVLLSTAASADFIGLTAEPFVGDGWICNGFDGLTAWRVYANFDGNGDDGVISVFGMPGSPWSMQSSNGVFENAPPEIDSACAPEDLTGEGIWENQWDTYLTINRTESDGSKCGGDDSECLNGLVGDFDCGDAGLFVTPDDEESYPVDGRVLIGQFTVVAGEVVTGSVNLLTRENEVWSEEIVPIDCRPDLDRSRDVGFGDLLTVLGDWGPCDPPCDVCPADLDVDGVVGFQDVLIVLAAWGDC